jgi:hypothetical protein
MSTITNDHGSIPATTPTTKTRNNNNNNNNNGTLLVSYDMKQLLLVDV